MRLLPFLSFSYMCAYFSSRVYKFANNFRSMTGVGNLSLAAGQNYNLQGLSVPYKFTINSVVKTCEFMKF